MRIINISTTQNPLTIKFLNGRECGLIYSAVRGVRSTNGNMSHKWDRFWNEEFITQIEVLSRNLPGGTEEY
jgi:hypothetical protein